MHNMTSRTLRNTILAVSALVLSMALYGGVWYMLQQSETTVRERITEQAESATQEATLSKLEKVSVETEADRAELHSYILKDDGASDFLELLEKTARSQGLTPTTRSVQIEAIKGNASFEALSLSLEVNGSYEGVSAMLTLLESLPYQSEIRSVSLDRTEGADGSSMWRGTFILRVIKEKGT